MNEQEKENQELQELFPFVKRWRSLYLFVLIELAGLIGLFYWFSQAFK